MRYVQPVENFFLLSLFYFKESKIKIQYNLNNPKSLAMMDRSENFSPRIDSLFAILFLKSQCVMRVGSSVFHSYVTV